MGRGGFFAFFVTAAIVGLCGEVRAECANRGDFSDWLEAFKAEAVGKGISAATVEKALGNIRFDSNVIAKDRAQNVFSQDFLQFAGRMADGYRLPQGKKKLSQLASTFSRIESEFGVPGPVVVSFWGLETDFGANIGDSETLRSLATLAYDCRRPELFREQLTAALKVIDRGDLTPDQMRGPWAGELGQLQFLPTHYFDYGVDFDGDGRRDLLRSSPDALASAANYMRHLGWKAGEPWLKEVRVPAEMPWDQADLAIEHPHSKWAEWGVTAADGSALSGATKASLLLPMGRNGPAFLAYPNFRVYLEWNQSLVYSTTAAYYATRLAGAGKVGNGRGDTDSLSFAEVKQLQGILTQRGYDVGGIDGFVGEKTRAAVKDMQQKLGLAMDSYPTGELLRRLR